MLDTYQQIEDLINELKIVRVDLSGDGEPISQVEEPVVKPETIAILAELLVKNGVIIQKKGHWIFRDGSIYATCSVCKKSQAYVYDQDTYQKYCGCCGAKMSLEEPI